MKKYTLTILILLLVSGYGFARYSQALGVQGGIQGLGLTYKGFLSPNTYVEIDGQGNYGNQRTGGFGAFYFGLYKPIRNSMLKVDGLSWVLNVGMHTGYYTIWQLGQNENFILGPTTKFGIEMQIIDAIIIGGYGRLYYNVVHTNENRMPDDWLDAGLFIRFKLR